MFGIISYQKAYLSTGMEQYLSRFFKWAGRGQVFWFRNDNWWNADIADNVGQDLKEHQMWMPIYTGDLSNLDHLRS